jgi:hypothetical protein
MRDFKQNNHACDVKRLFIEVARSNPAISALTPLSVADSAENASNTLVESYETLDS